MGHIAAEGPHQLQHSEQALNLAREVQTYNRVNPAGSANVGEPALKLRAWEGCPHYSSALWWHGQGTISLFPHPHRIWQAEELAL